MLTHPCDTESLAFVHATSFEDAWSADWIAKLMCQPGVFAFHDGADGFVLVRVAGGEAEILTLAVAPAARRRGFGAGLVAAGAHHAAQMGAQALFLEVNEANEAAKSLYLRLGFEEVARRSGYYGAAGEGGQHALVFRAKLPLRPWVNARLSTKLPAMDHADPSTRIERLCIDKGLRMTEQRRIIARVLSEAADHPDAEELYKRASSLDPHISIATVYRTVKLFEDAGILERHDFRDGRSRYEELPESHHDHLIDIQSGNVIEFRNEEIERLQRRVAEELGFELVDHRLELYGVPKKAR